MEQPAAGPAGARVLPAAAAPARRGRRLLLALSLALSLVLLDQWSKAAVFDWIGEERHTRANADLVSNCAHASHLRYPVLGRWLALMPSENPGAAWGLGRDHSEVLVYGRILAGLLLLALLFRAPRGQRAYWLSLTLVLAGAVGNLMDNLWLGTDPDAGHSFRPVRDFIDVYFERWEYHFPTFNVADSCITTGAVLLLLSGLFRRREAAE